MHKDTFHNISKIIQRDSKTTTYKFALLRGVIDIIQDNSPYIEFLGDRVRMPLGLLVEKWLLYYYPLLQSEQVIPQINGDSQLAFGSPLQALIRTYKSRGGLSAFYNDLRVRGIPQDLQPDLIDLTLKIRDTIVKMPMRYIGRSISDTYYSIFAYHASGQKRPPTFDYEQMVRSYGTFTLPLDYYEAFRILGSFMSGSDSILFKWAEFSVNASGNALNLHHVLDEVLRTPTVDREVAESKKLYAELHQRGQVYCVWTGRRLSSTYDIDHLIPFSVWKNNDLWNLLPADPKVNTQKRDKIPSPILLERQADQIQSYWYALSDAYADRFQREVRTALLGYEAPPQWEMASMSRLKSTCTYLIEGRGFEAWEPRA